MAEEQKTEEHLRHIVRIARTDLKGQLPLVRALRNVNGIGFGLANALCIVAGLPKQKMIGLLDDETLHKIDTILENPGEYGVPTWLLNRRHDPETGMNKHLSGTNLDYQTDNDIKFMRKIRCYKGVRHSLGQPVRGQRTRSNFRRNKGNAVGVKKTKTER